MSHWWRAHDEAVDDPKLQLLPDAMFRAWFNVMCLTSANEGTVPPLDHVAFKLRLTPSKAAKVLEALTTARLLDQVGDRLHPHNWEARQFKSDVSTERVKQFRKRRGNVSSSSNETFLERPQTTDSEPETERKKEDVAASAAPTTTVSYIFESGVIRLKKKDFDQWKQAFEHIDLAAELVGLTEWAGQQAKWFPAVSGALAKRNREVKAVKDKASADPKFKWNGIEGVL